MPGARIVGNEQVEVRGLAYDSRRVESGDLFICVPGGRTDGHLHAGEAIARGARSLVVQSGREGGLKPPAGGAIAVVPDSRAAMPAIARAFYHDPSSRLTLAGVTGTNGKTTTAAMLYEMFGAAGMGRGLIGTVEYRVGERRLAAPHTTPEAVDLQALLAELVAEGATHAAMEVSSHALALHRADGCKFRGAVFTNLTPEHLDFHADMGEYLETKLRLFEDRQYFPEDERRVNVVNVDDEAGGEIARRARGETLTYGLEREADCRAEEVELRPDGTTFAALLPAGRVRVQMKLLGGFNVYNALAALAAASALGVPLEAARQGLEAMAPVRGRLERVPAKQRTVLVDYAHSPDALRRALEAARQLARGKLIVVFGCGGDRDRTKRPVMGGLASRLADACVITSDNPRSEEPEAIIAEIAAGIGEDSRGKCALEPDRAKAIRLALEQAGPNDLVLIAGKGHEDYQIFADRTIHFDDREQAEAVLKELEGGDDA